MHDLISQSGVFVFKCSSLSGSWDLIQNFPPLDPKADNVKLFNLNCQWPWSFCFFTFYLFEVWFDHFGRVCMVPLGPKWVFVRLIKQTNKHNLWRRTCPAHAMYYHSSSSNFGIQDTSPVLPLTSLGSRLGSYNAMLICLISRLVCSNYTFARRHSASARKWVRSRRTLNSGNLWSANLILQCHSDIIKYIRGKGVFDLRASYIL